MLRTPPDLNTIVQSVLANAQRSFTFPLAWRHKMFHLKNGYLSKDSIWDKSFLYGPRKAVLKSVAESLRAIIVSGGMSLKSGLQSPC